MSRAKKGEGDKWSKILSQLKESNDSNLLRGNGRGRGRLPALVYRANEREARKFGCTGNTARGGYLSRLYSSREKKNSGSTNETFINKGKYGRGD
jgi:hypothetical protein